MATNSNTTAKKNRKCPVSGWITERGWHVVDPLGEKYYPISPYAYVANNPVVRTDPDGRLSTDFRDKLDKRVKQVDDGSNAVFKQTGDGSGLHYVFDGFNESQGGENKIVMSTAIQEQQILNNENSSLEENALGLDETHCNQSTQNVLKTVSSIFNNESIKVDGLANEMLDKMESGKIKNIIPVDYSGAKINAKQGGLSIAGYRPIKGTGHILTFSVGANISKGEVQNIGPKKYSGFVSLNNSISKNKPKVYYIFAPNIMNETIIKPK